MNGYRRIRPETGAPASAAGTTLLEVLLAIVIFVVGMLALVQLQGNLTRSSTDANLRTVAANVAEELIEQYRGFEKVPADPNTTKLEYAEIVDDTLTRSRGGITYNVDVDVDDYYFMPDGQSVTTNVGDLPANRETTYSDFKQVTLTVSWDGASFDVGDSGDNRLGSGSIVVSDIIPSIPSLGTASVAAEDDGAVGSPPVDYTPGLNPDVVAIQLGENKFKESTTPEPVVVRRDELMETWFDVITYARTDTDAIFLRREEFVSISCECTLHDASGSGEDGRQPTIWTGAAYAEGELVGKPYGVSASNQQSQYCDVCCRDHHDTAGGPDSYLPQSSSSRSGDHPHYRRTNQGVLEEVSAGQDYIEACRLVRKDGFFRVAQDFMLQSQLAFPENYLDDDSEVMDYSDYVTQAVDDHYDGVANAWDSSLSYDGVDADNPTDLPTDQASDSQQLRSRAIYADLISDQLQDNLDNCFGPSGDRSMCEAPEADDPIELYPFFDVQVTKLARWTEIQPADPVDITNDEISNNAYSRGLAELAGSRVGTSVGHSNIETGNSGLVSIDPFAPSPAYSDAALHLRAGEGTEPPPDALVVSGTLVNSNQAGREVASVTGVNATCTRPTNTTFQCVLTAAPATLTVSNYYKANQSLIACSSDLETTDFTQGDSPGANSTTFLLPTGTVSNVSIVISTYPCP